MYLIFPLFVTVLIMDTKSPGVVFRHIGQLHNLDQGRMFFFSAKKSRILFLQKISCNFMCVHLIRSGILLYASYTKTSSETHTVQQYISPIGIRDAR